MLCEQGVNFWLLPARYYRPLPLTVLQIIFLLFGYDPLPYHVVSLVISSANCYLAYLLGKNMFKNGASALFLLIGWIACSCIYFEVFAWIAPYFDLFYFFFALLGCLFFVKHVKTEKMMSHWFFLAVIFVSLSILCKESGIFCILGFILFEFFSHESVKKTLIGIIKHVSFAPILLVFLYFKILGGTLETGYFPWIVYVFLGVYLIPLPFLCYLLYKSMDNMKKLLYSLSYFAGFLLAFGITQRFWYVTSYFVVFVIMYEYFDSHGHSISSFFRHLHSSTWSKKRILLLVGVIGLITTNFCLVASEAFTYNIFSTATRNITFTIMNDYPASTNKTIYLVNVPYSPYVWALHENHVYMILNAISGNSYKIAEIYIDDAFAFMFQGQEHWGAEKVSISQFDAISTDTVNNTVYLFSYATLTITNVSGLTYADIFQ
ncbi:MAG: glycosyltransferase family 39 protein [Candidatus Helarchaeales archaeon]